MRNKLIMAGAGLFGYGVLIGWAITGDKFEKKMKSNQLMLASIIDKKTRELDGARELFSNVSHEAVDETVVELVSEHEKNQVQYNKPVVSSETDVQTGDERFMGETPEETKANLQNLINGYVANKEDVEAFDHMASRVVADGVDNTPPFVISQGTYAWDEEGEDHAKITLKWYPQQRVLLVEDEEELIEDKDVDGYVGWRNLDRFGDESGDPEVVFIRNRRLNADYEVVRETETELPAHIRYGFGRREYENFQATGVTRFRRGDVGD